MRAIVATKRGRPRKALPQQDDGTPELRAHRQALAGREATAAEHPLALMLARGLISAEHYDAGQRYAALYRQSVGRTQISYNRLYEELAGRFGRQTLRREEADMAAARRLYLAAKADLLAAGARICRATEALVVFGDWPPFLLRSRGGESRPSPAHGDHCAGIQAGLDILLGFWRRDRRLRRAANDNVEAR